MKKTIVLSIFVFIVFYLGFLLSCQKEVKTLLSDKKGEVKASSAQTPVNNVISGIITNTARKNEVLRQFQEENQVKINRESIAIGKAKFSDIALSADLVKEESQVKSYILQAEKVDSDYLCFLESQGLTVGDYVPQSAVLVKADSAAVKIKGIKGVKSAVPYQPFMKIAKSDGGIENIRKAKIRLWDAKESLSFTAFCESNAVKVLSKTGRDFIVEGRELKPILFEESVMRLEKYHEPAVFSVSGENAEKLLTSSVNVSFLKDSGLGVNVSVYDVGIDKNQADLSGAIRNVYETAGDGDTGELTSHGTHTAGIIAGRGNNSLGKIAGVNSGAKIDFFAMGDDLKGLVIPASMRNLLGLSIQNHSTIANLSWGTYDEDLKGRYLSISRDIDEFVYTHPELIVITAVGNNGKSIASPATAKNVISVGALDGTNLVSYSGRGGCSDGRVKPDLVVQGSSILSLGLNNSYVAENGTSQAAAIVSGMVSRLYGLLKSRFSVNPTHSVVKAFLIANTLEDAPAGGFGFGKVFFGTPIDTAHFELNCNAVGESKRIVKAGDTISVVLAWTEPPAFESSFAQLINLFDVEVKSPSGNVFHFNGPENNVRKLVIRNTEAGEYSFQVTAKFAPMDAKDRTLLIKSALGFGEPEKQSSDLAAAQNQTVDSSQNGGYVYQAPNSTGQNTGENSSSVSADSGVNGGNTISGTSADTAAEKAAAPIVEEASDPLQEIALMNSEKDPFDQETKRIYGRPGNNTLETRILGASTNSAFGLQVTGRNVTAQETTVPVQNDLNGEYSKWNVALNPPDTNGMTGSFQLRNQTSGETNVLPIIFMIDGQPPYLVERFPLPGKTLTNTAPWIEVIDQDSGVDSEMALSINGVLLSSNQFEYNFGNKRLTINLDKVTGSRNRQEMLVEFIKVKDMAGNEMTNSKWNFIFDPTFDQNPPDKPRNVTASLTNKKVLVRWDNNEEKDILGYCVYLVDSDYLSRERVNADFIPTNSIEFKAYSVKNIGVSAMDTSSNESGLAIIPLDYEYQNSPPSLFVEGVPEKTNGNILGKIRWMDEGFIISTNLLLDGNTLPVVWSATDGTFIIEENGKHELFAGIMDDDSNRVSNVIHFELDKNAPSAPAQAGWESAGKDVKLYWTPIFKNGAQCLYNVYLDQEKNARNLTNTNLTLIFDDYGTHYLAVSALDGMGNESAKAYVLANTEKGIVMLLTNSIFSREIPLLADIMISTNRYEKIVVSLSNKGKSGLLSFSQEFEACHRLSCPLDVSKITDGNYILALSIRSGDVEYSASRECEIDRTPPMLSFVLNGKTNSGNYFVLGKDQVLSLGASDKNFQSMRIGVESDGVSSEVFYQTNSAVFPGSKSFSAFVEAFDKAGNRVYQRAQVVFDDKKPEMAISISNRFVFGRVFDENLRGFTILTNNAPAFGTEFGIDGDICALPARFEGRLDAYAFDIAGNSNTFTTNLSIEDNLSNSIGQILVNGGTNLYYNTSSLEVSYTGNWDGMSEYSAWKGEEQLFSSGWIKNSIYDLSGLPEGGLTVRVSAGGMGFSRDVIVDTVRPAIVVNPYCVQNTPLSRVYHTTDLHLEGSRALLDGRESMGGEALSSGQHELSVYSWDYAGNSNQLTTSVYVSAGSPDFEEITADLANGKVICFSPDGSIETNSIASFGAVTHSYKKPVRMNIIGEVNNPVYEANQKALSEPVLREEGSFNVRLYANASMTMVDGQPPAPFNKGDVLTASFKVALDFTKPAIKTGIAEGGVYQKMPEIAISDTRLLSSNITIDGAAWNSSPLFDGKHYVSIKAEDRAGNTNFFEASFYIDTEKPAIVTRLTNGGYYSGLPEISVYDANPDRTSILIDHETNVNALNNGPHSLRILAIDKARNSNSLSADFFIDSHDPAVSIEPSEGVYREAAAKVHVDEPDLQALQVYLNGKAIDAGITNAGIVLTNEGDFEIAVYARDKAGNHTSAKGQFSIDRTPPRIAVNNLIDGMAYPVNTTPDILVEDRHFKSAEYFLDGLPYEGMPIARMGGHILNIKAMDLAGNTAEKEIHFTILDHLPVVILFGLNGVYDFGAYFNDSYFRLNARVEGGTAEEVSIVADGFERTMPAAFDRDGSHEVYAKAKINQNGTNYTIASSVYKICVDKSAPRIILNGVENGKTITSKIIASAKGADWIQNFDVTLNGAAAAFQKIETNTIDQSVNFTFTLSPWDAAVLKNNTLLVSAKDVLGRESKQSLSFQADKDGNIAGGDNTNDSSIVDDHAAPLITLNHYYDDMVVSNLTASVSIADEHYAGCQLELFTNNVPVGFAIISNQNKIELSTVREWWEEGAYQMKVTAFDGAGNFSYKTLEFSIDRVNPVIAVSGVGSGDCLSILDADVDIREGHPYQSRLYLDGSLIGSNQNKFHVSSIENGAHSLLIWAEDFAGNQSSLNIPFTVDSGQPAIAVDGVEAGGLYNTDRPVKITAVDENLSGWFVTNRVVYGRAMESFTNFYRITSGEADFTASGELDNVLTILAIDRANNSWAASISYRIDKTAPSISWNGLSDGGRYNDVNKWMAVNVSDESGSGVAWAKALCYQYTNSGWVLTENSGFSNSRDFTYPNDGIYRVTIDAMDKAGNENVQSFDFIIDKIRPVASISGAENLYTNQDVILTITMSDEYIDPAKSLIVLTNSVYGATNAQNVSFKWNGTNWSTQLHLISEARYDLSVQARDLAGNPAETNMTLYLDKTPPGASFNTIGLFADGTTNGTRNCFYHDSTIHLLNSDGGANNAPVDTGIASIEYQILSNGVLTTENYSNDFAFFPLWKDFSFDKEGNYQLSARVFDWAGNSASISTPFVIDRTPPTAFFVKDMVTTNTSIQSNGMYYVTIQHDISNRTKTFQFDSIVMDENNVRSLTIWTNETNSQCVVLRVTNNNAALNRESANFQAESFSKILAEKRKLMVQAKDFAGNPMDLITVNYSYTNSKPPRVVYHTQEGASFIYNNYASRSNFTAWVEVVDDVGYFTNVAVCGTRDDYKIESVKLISDWGYSYYVVSNSKATTNFYSNEVLLDPSTNWSMDPNTITNTTAKRYYANTFDRQFTNILYNLVYFQTNIYESGSGWSKTTTVTITNGWQINHFTGGYSSGTSGSGFNYYTSNYVGTNYNFTNIYNGKDYTLSSKTVDAWTKVDVDVRDIFGTLWHIQGTNAGAGKFLVDVTGPVTSAGWSDIKPGFVEIRKFSINVNRYDSSGHKGGWWKVWRKVWNNEEKLYDESSKLDSESTGELPGGYEREFRFEYKVEDYVGNVSEGNSGWVHW
jgi:hypothetical protein